MLRPSRNNVMKRDECVQSYHALNCKWCIQICLTYQIILYMLSTSKGEFLSKRVNYPLESILLMKQNLQNRRCVEKLTAS